MSHCNATDGDYVWVQRRHAKQQETGMSTSGTATFTISSAARRRMDLRMDPRHITAAEVGPFELNHTQAIADSAFSQCRKCGWHSRLGNYFCGGRYTASTKYCRKCGRVATQEDCTNQVQSHPYTPKPTDYCLGTKEIPFTLVPRDIRAVEKYKDSWASEHWVYDESEMAEESFQHKLGQRPTILSILEMLSEYPKELKKSEADAIFLSDNKDLPLLRVLQKVSSFGKTLCAVNPLISKADGIAGDISATYCKQSCSGVSTTNLSQNRCFSISILTH